MWFSYHCHLKPLQVKNIAMEILDFYENYRSITEEKVNSAFSKLALKP